MLTTTAATALATPDDPASRSRVRTDSPANTAASIAPTSMWHLRAARPIRAVSVAALVRNFIPFLISPLPLPSPGVAFAQTTVIASARHPRDCAPRHRPAHSATASPRFGRAHPRL